jgi:ankyrin repeat protein
MEAQIYDLLKNKKTAELIELVKNDPKLLAFVDSRGASLLMISFYFRNAELSDYILSQRSPLDIYESVIAGDLASTKKYLSANKELVNKHSKDGFTPLGFAAFFGRPDVASFLLREGADPNIASSNDFKVAPIHSSVAAKNLEITQMLLDRGANPNAQQQNDVTPLQGAAHNNSLDIVRALLNAGAIKDMKTKDGKTAMDFAKEVDAKEIIALL